MRGGAKKTSSREEEKGEKIFAGEKLNRHA